MHWVKTLLISASCIVTMQCPVESARGDFHFVRSADGEHLAFVSRRGEGAVSLSEIWHVSPKYESPRKLTAFPGEPGTLHFAPGGDELIYLERSLRREAWGSYFYGGQPLPITRNRVWRLRLDGAGEEAWPLPGDLQPLEIALSPDGRSLAIAGYRGSELAMVYRGLWIVNDRGDIRHLFAGDVAGPVAWSADGNSVRCRINDGAESIRVHVDTGEAVPIDIKKDIPMIGKRSHEPFLLTRTSPGMREADGADAALGLIGTGLDLYIRGRNALHRGNEARAEKMLEQSRRAFRKLYDGAAKYGLSRKSCTRYIEVCEDWIEADTGTTDRHNCRERLTGMLRLIEGFKRTRDGSEPADLGELHQWATARIVAETPSGNERDEYKTILGVLFSCPVNRDYAFLSDYLYRHEGLPAAPDLACFWHRGERIDGIAGRAGGHTKTSIPRAAQVDSLAASGRRAMDGDDLDRARLIFRSVARQRPRDPDAYVNLGHILLKLRRFEESKDAFHRALTLGSKALGHHGLGMLYATWPMQRHFAIHHFTEALVRDRNFVDARYQMARVRYAMKQRDAELEAKRVLKMDPGHAGAYLMIADYYLNLSWEFEKAVVWYTKYLALRPEDADAQRRMGVAYLKVRDYSRIMDHLLDFVKRHPEAIELMPIIAISAIEQDKADMAMAFFEDYISKLDPEVKGLYEDISLVASGEDLRASDETPGLDRETYLRRFWNGKDPDLSTPVNERLLEHYRRVWYALTEFSEGKQPWDARGDVYVRFGEPDHRSRSDDPNFKQSLKVQRVKERLAYNIYKGDVRSHTFVGPVYPVRSLKQLDGAWYELREVKIENSEPSACEIAGAADHGTQAGDTEPNQDRERDHFFVNDDSVKLGILPLDESLGFGDYHPVTTGEDRSTVPWETWIYTGAGGGIEITFTDEIGSGIYDYAPVPPNQGDISLGETATLSRHAPHSVYRRAARVTPDFYTPRHETPPLDFHYSLADFRGEEGRSLLEIYYGVPILPAHYVPEEDFTRQVLTHHAALISSSQDTVYRRTDEMTYEAAGNQAGEGLMVPDVLKLDLPPGAYRLEVKSQDRLRGRTGIYQQQVGVDRYGEERLQISDLEMAWQVGAANPTGKFAKGDLNVIPMPSRTYKKGQSVFVYYEIYNLDKDAFGQTNFNVSHTITSRDTPGRAGNISRLFRWGTGRREELAVTYEQLGASAQVEEYVELALDVQDPGRYSLKVSISDRNSGESVEKDVAFVITP
ncbi:MAG: GWxTD domain-containing protein [Gemmatimonadota bacterium]|nr:GWxTD domain-containing protein [Gemmatimonadota bacterium]